MFLNFLFFLAMTTTTSATAAPDPSSHWLPGVERRGLGNLVMGVNHISFVVSDVGRSVSFYTDILGLQQVGRPNLDRHGAWLTTGNVELHLIKGTPLVHTGDNLIVCHWALDVSDPDLAFQRLREMRVPFEINVSVPKGGGSIKSEAVGGSREETLGQAFLRDPDGYYIELCNCHVLTDFALGRTSGMVDEKGHEVLSTLYVSEKPISLFCMGKLAALASRAKKRCQARAQCHRCLEVARIPRDSTRSSLRQSAIQGMDGIPPHLDTVDANKNPADDDASEESLDLFGDQDNSNSEGEDVFIDEQILSNFMARRLVYGDICQSFDCYDFEDLLVWSNNHAPTAILLMLDEIYKGKKRIFQPPAYYVEGSQYHLKNHDTTTEKVNSEDSEDSMTERTEDMTERTDDPIPRSSIASYTSSETQYRPQAFEAPSGHRKSSELSVLTAGLRSLRLSEKQCSQRRLSNLERSVSSLFNNSEYLKMFAESMASFGAWTSDNDDDHHHGEENECSFYGDDF